MPGTNPFAVTFLTFSLFLTKIWRAYCPPEELKWAKAGSEEGNDERKESLKVFYL